jgi:hypothetical protein
MQSEFLLGPRYIARISRHGAEGFGWTILREADSIELLRSTRLVATLIEAIVESARAAEPLHMAFIEDRRALECESLTGCD